MKHILKTFLLFLCIFVTGNVRADLVQEWQGKIAQRAESPVTTLADGWYVLYNVNRNSCVLDNGSAYKMAEMPAAGTYLSADEKGGMFFHITAASDGKWRIASALGHNVALGDNNSSQPDDAHEFTIDHIGENTDVFYLVDTNTGYVADGQERGNAFVGWDTTVPTGTNGHNVYKFYAVSTASAVEVNYHITATDAQGENPISWSISQYETLGSYAGSTLNDSYEYVNDFICSSSNVIISASNTDFDFTATHTFPMVPGKKYQVRQTGSGNRYMAAIADNDDNVTLRATRTVDDANNVWSVVQAANAPYFYIVNEARNQSIKAVGSGNGDCINYYAIGDSQAQVYEFVADGGNFKLYEPGTNHNVGAHGYYGGSNSSLGAWNSGRGTGNGTTFVAEEVTPYTISISGCDAGRVIYNGAEYPDGTTLYFPLGDHPTFTAKSVDNFEFVDETQGTLVKVRYIDMSAPFFDITYRYVDAVTEQLIESVTTSCRYETEFPAPKEFAGKQVLNAPKGTVTDNAEFTILVLTLDGEDQPDPVKPATVQLTYRVVGSDGAVWYTETVTANNGEAYPALNTTLPVGVTLTMPTGTLSTMQTELTVDIPCTSTFALKYADSYNNIKQWYGVTITNAKTPFHYEQGDTYMTLSGSASYETKYLFALVGNPFTGFKLYNKAAGNGKVLSSGDPATKTNTNGQVGNGQYCWPVMTDESDLPDGNNIYWDFTANSSGYFLSRHGESDFHLNSRADSGNGGSVLAYWNNTDDGSRVYFAPEGVEVLSANPSTATATAASPATDKVYRIYSVRHGGRMIMENAEHKLMKTTERQQGDLRQLWVLETSTTNGAFTLRNAETGRFIVAPTGNNAQVTTQTSAAPLYFIQKTVSTENGGNPYYGIGANADGTGNVWMNTNTNISNVVGWSLGNDGGSGWVIEEASDVTLDEVKAHVKGNSPFSTLESGKYYRLVNKVYPNRYMAEGYTNGDKVWGLPSGTMPNDNCQLWQITGDASTGYTFQNVFTGHYIADVTSRSTQFITTDQENSAKKFQVTSTGESDWNAPQYAFYRGGGNDWGLHCAESQSYWVVTWTYSNAPATYWNLEPVVLSSDEAAAIHQEYLDYLVEKDALNQIAANAADINAALSKVFADAACTEMYEGYKSLSDYRLRTVLSALGLPEEIQEMAVCVKNNTWELDPKRNGYTKRFRIHDYMPYSDRDVWAEITKVGGFAKFTNPTGITLRNGETATIYVDADPVDGDAVLGVYVVADTEYNTNDRFPLVRGLNIITAPKDGELIIDYRVTSPDKYVLATDNHPCDYPNIRIHIEGGAATGCWDATRNMNSDDWQWLCANAFEAPFLHVKGESTMLNLVTSHVMQYSATEDVARIMKAWDFCFEDLQRLIGHDGQWDGRYHPMINPRHSYKGNPNWGGQGGSNHPTLVSDKGYLFKLSNFTESNVWEILHEEGHGHQDVIEMAGTTEVTNNSLSQMVSYDWGLCYSRGDGASSMIDLFNFTNNSTDKQGWAWLDYVRYAKPYYDASLHVGNQLLYKLYLYFDVLGNYPTRDFIPRLHDWLRNDPDGGIVRGHRNDPGQYYNDYWKVARAAAEITDTDLWEFFEAHGFWKWAGEEMSTRPYNASEPDKSDPEVGSDAWNSGVRFVGDYGNWFMRLPVQTNPEDVQRMNDMRDFMHSRTHKAPNILFIDDRVLSATVDPESPVAKLDPSKAGTPKRHYWDTMPVGDFGNFTEFDNKNHANEIEYSIGSETVSKNWKTTSEQAYTTEGRTVTMTGDGLVGVKIYDADGNLIYLANDREFFIPTALAEQLESGEATLIAALSDNTNLPLAKPSAQKHKMIVYNGAADDTQTYFVTGEAAPANVPYSTLTGTTDVPVLSGNAMVLMPEDSDYFSLPKALKQANVFTWTEYEGTPVWMANSVEITDKQNFYLPEGDYVAGFAHYTRSNTAGLNSVCLPFDTQISSYGTGAKAYVLKEVGDDIITFSEVDEIPAGTFAIVDCGDNGATWQLGGETQLIGSPRTDGVSVGSFQNAVIGEGKYKLNGAGDAFGVTSANGKVTAFRGYIAPTAPLSSNLRLCLEDFAAPTSIDAAEALSQPSEAYDLSGRRIISFERGKTYIINGKKTIFK